MSRPVILVASRELYHMGHTKRICSNENALKEKLTQLETWFEKELFTRECQT